ncbi:MAG: dioxygenase [Chthoniobacterales bacterium]
MQSVAPKTNAVTITEAALRSFDNTPDPRSKQLLPAVVKHLHAFAREVDLTTNELNKLAEIFTQAGKISDASRHEFLLMNDIMGLTMVAGLALRRPD